jgi:signal transduction histidine kinase
MSRHRPSLSSAPFRAALLVLLALALFIAIFWSINEYQSHHERIANIEKNYKELYQERVQEELANVIEFIEQQRSQAVIRVEDELRKKVQSAYTIASHIYQMQKDAMNSGQLRSMVVETLRPIRWNNGQGYYFAGSVTGKRIDLFAEDPLLEGQNPMEVRGQRYKTIFQDLTRIIREKGAGMYRNGENADPTFSGMHFVKYFKPFDWYIGATTSQEVTKTVLQEEILTTVQRMRFSKDGHILCFDAEGTILSHPNSVLIGRSITELVNEKGDSYGRMMLDIGLQNESGGTLLYTSVDGLSGKAQQRLSFIKPYTDWNWILLVDISMSAMEKTIDNEMQTATTTSIKNAFTFLGLLLIAVLFLTGMAYYHSVKTKRGIKLFTNFFRKAAHTQVKIRHTDSTFSEFEKLAELANTMVDDIVQKEHLLHRDELRLDTLLQLSEMEEYRVVDKYDFVLHRIIQITDSSRGYLALVNKAQTHCTLCSQINMNTGRIGLSTDEDHLPLLLTEGGLIGSCVLEKKTFICNAASDICSHSLHPYKADVGRRIDIPVFDKNTAVLVAGVCNSSREYDNSDIRQITMLTSSSTL